MRTGAVQVIFAGQQNQGVISWSVPPQSAVTASTAGTSTTINPVELVSAAVLSAHSPILFEMAGASVEKSSEAVELRRNHPPSHPSARRSGSALRNLRATTRHVRARTGEMISRLVRPMCAFDPARCELPQSRAFEPIRSDRERASSYALRVGGLPRHATTAGSTYWATCEAMRH